MEEGKCGFCHTGAENETICGALHKDKVNEKPVCAHHKCMQYSALLVQYRSATFGGFKKQDVMKEIKRGSRLICTLCKVDKTKKFKKGATSGCAWASCRKTFHYLCVSMNPKTVAKRYRVAAGDKEVILYRVFCCQDHENRYRVNLSAEDVVGRNQSSDDDLNSETENLSSDDEEKETPPPAKKSKTKHTDEKDNAESGISSPGMTADEIISETKRQYNLLTEKRKNAEKKENGEGSVSSTGQVDLGDNMSEDLNAANSPDELDHGDRRVVRNLDEGFHIIIPSKLDVGDIKTFCKKAGYAQETCTLWPKGYNRKGLQDKHMPFIMWNLASKLSTQDPEEFIKPFMHVSLEQYESLYSLYEDIDDRHVIETKLIHLSEEINEKFKSEICCVRKLSSGEEKFYIMVISLPKDWIEVCDVWSLVNVYKWCRKTVAPLSKCKHSSHSYEKQVLLHWLLPRLNDKSCEVSIYPLEESIRLDHGHVKFASVAKEIEFRLETISQSLLAKSLVKILVVRKVNRSIVNFKEYLQQTVQLFFTKNADHECYMVVDVLPSDHIHTLYDILPNNVLPNTVVYSALDPSIRPVSCLILYSSPLTGFVQDISLTHSLNTATPEFEDAESLHLYLDVDDSPIPSPVC